MADKTHLIASRGIRLYHLVDAKNEVLGRLAPQVARLLAGKHKPTYTPSRDAGDWVVVVNARDVALTGNKREQKLYQWHTGWPGGLKTLTARQVFERDPRRVVAAAVKGMLAPNLLRRDRLRRLRVFPGEAHGMEGALAASRAYAGEHLDAHRPASHRPRAAARSVGTWESAPAATEEEARGAAFAAHDSARREFLAAASSKCGFNPVTGQEVAPQKDNFRPRGRVCVAGGPPRANRPCPPPP
jgi:large subunit ribosomal protein L13